MLKYSTTTRVHAVAKAGVQAARAGLQHETRLRQNHWCLPARLPLSSPVSLPMLAEQGE